jgi:hypothetical protein
MDPFFGDLCQRGRKHEPKAKGPHHHPFKSFGFQLVLILERVFFKWYDFEIGISLCSKGGERVVFSKSTS